MAQIQCFLFDVRVRPLVTSSRHSHQCNTTTTCERARFAEEGIQASHTKHRIHTSSTDTIKSCLGKSLQMSADASPTGPTMQVKYTILTMPPSNPVRVRSSLPRPCAASVATRPPMAEHHNILAGIRQFLELSVEEFCVLWQSCWLLRRHPTGGQQIVDLYFVTTARFEIISHISVEVSWRCSYRNNQ